MLGVAEEIADAGLHELGGDFAVAAGERLDDRAIEPVVEGVGAAVQTLERVARVRRRLRRHGGAAAQGERREQDQQGGVVRRRG